jgi:hypothetical protein
MALPVVWDAKLAAAEVRRVSKKGVHSLTFTENPAALGYPSFHHDYCAPLSKALVAMADGHRRNRSADDAPARLAAYLRLAGPSSRR